MSISFPSADFAPTLSGYTGQGPFRFWCQKVLPIVYDDSLSYYELLCKVVNYLNNVIADVATVEENVGEIVGSFDSLQDYVNTHMNELVIAFNQLQTFVDEYFENLDVQAEINAKLDEMASDGSLTELVAPIVAETAPSIITDWLDNNITPTTPVIDRSLSVAKAGADAQVVGAAFSVNNNFLYPALEQGNISMSGPSANNYLIRTTEYILIPAKSRVQFHLPDNYEYAYYTYANTGDTQATGGVANSDFWCANDTYIRVKMNKTPLSVITPNDVSLVISVTPIENEIYEKEHEGELIYNHSNGHVEKISVDDSYGLTYRYVNGNITPFTLSKGSKFIKCKPTDLFNVVYKQTSNVTFASAYVYIYIYNENFELQTSYIFTGTADGPINRMYNNTLQDYCGNQITGIPDGYYIQFCYVNGQVDVYKWDGVKFGTPPLAQPAAYDKDSNSVYCLLPNGGSGIILPGNYRYVIAKPGYTFISMAYLTTNGVVEYDTIGSGKLCPTQVLWTGRRVERKIVTVVKNYNYETGEYDAVVETGLLGDYISVITFDNYSVNNVQGQAENRLRNLANPLALVKWSPARDLLASDYNDRSFYGVFRVGVVYNGIPYGSRWLGANYVGWHVSIHTFVNAANDPLSVFNTLGGTGNHEGLYYSLVCTAFTGIIGGFPYPMTNPCLVNHPYVNSEVEFNPSEGNIYTNGTGHCVYCVGNECDDEGALTVTFVESLSPVVNYTQHYKSVSSNIDPTGVSFYGYSNRYFYRVSPKKVSSNLYSISETRIVNGGARPNRGDKSVYTSNMDIVANIYDDSASYVIVRGYKMEDNNLVYDPDIGEVERLPINHNEQVTIPKRYLVSGKIYGICTDTNAENEFFEYYETEAVEYSIVDGVLVLPRDPETNKTIDFWYCVGSDQNDDWYSIGYEESGDYSIYRNYVALKRSVFDVDIKFFRRGVFGAYVVNP